MQNNDNQKNQDVSIVGTFKNKPYNPSVDSVSGWKIFTIAFLVILYYSQSAREMLLDRGIITVVLPLLLILIFGGLLAALLLKFLSLYIVLIVFGLLGAIGRILLSIADQPMSINDSSYPIYNTGMYLSFLAFAPVWIALFGIINLQASKNQSQQSLNFYNPVSLVVSGILCGFVYHWLFRIIELAEYSLLNIMLGIVGLITYIVIINESVTYIRMSSSDQRGNSIQSYLNLLKKAPREQYELRDHYTRRSNKDSNTQKIRPSFILIAIPLFVYLSLPMSFPELYSYLSGFVLQYVVIAFIIGMAIGLIATIYSIEQMGKSGNDAKKVKSAQIYLKCIPIGAWISAIFFGLASFFSGPTPILILVYVVTGWAVSSLFLFVFSNFVELHLLHFDKLMMGIVTIMNLISVAVRLLTIERYIPYLEFIVGLTFAIPSLLIYRFLSVKQREGGRVA